MKGLLKKLLLVLFVTICMCSTSNANIRYERFDADVFCIIGVKDYCNTFEYINDEEFDFYSSDFEIDSFPGSAGESDDYYIYLGLVVLATTSEQSASDEKLTASVYALNFLDSFLTGFMVIWYSEYNKSLDLWAVKSLGFALFTATIDD